MSDKVSLEECRAILGASAESMTDAQVESLRDDLERTAGALHEEMTGALRTGEASLAEWQEACLLDENIPKWLHTDGEQLRRDAIEKARWFAYFQETGEGE
jgi:hypothetical protein